MLPAADVKRLSAALGTSPAVEGLSRQEVWVLAALARRPFGLASARAVARAAGISPTAAGRSLARLRDIDLVEQQTERVAAGTARDVNVWRVRRDSPNWHRVAPAVVRAEPPVMTLAPSGRVPDRLAHLFWNEDVRTLDTHRHGRLIASRVLRSGDTQALSWMVTAVDRADIAWAARGRGLDRRYARLAEALAG